MILITSPWRVDSLSAISLPVDIIALLFSVLYEIMKTVLQNIVQIYTLAIHNNMGDLDYLDLSLSFSLSFSYSLLFSTSFFSHLLIYVCLINIEFRLHNFDEYIWMILFEKLIAINNVDPDLRYGWLELKS